MNLQILLEKYINHPRIGTISERISLPQHSATRLTNLQGSASQFVMAAVYQHPSSSKMNHLVILDDAEEAAYFHNTLENLTNAIDLFYFPSSFKNRKNFRLLNSSHVMLRTESLTRFSVEGNKRIMVSYPDALFEKVVMPDELSRNIIRIKTNDTLDIDAVLERFVNYGFERTDFVYEPGQFAMRGGILDIYSFGNEKPYRIELFGNEVDSIRILIPRHNFLNENYYRLRSFPM
jgi:transcription-repair coupling factor (superfamily II helicase)